MSRSLTVLGLAVLLLAPAALVQGLALAPSSPQASLPASKAALPFADVMAPFSDASLGPQERALAAAQAALAQDAALAGGRLPSELSVPLARSRASLDLAARLLADAALPGDELARMVHAEHDASAGEAMLLGLSPVAVPSPATMLPSAGIAQLVARHGLALDASQVAAARGLDALPVPTRDAVGRVLAAFLVYEDATHVAFAGVDVAALRMPSQIPSALDAPVEGSAPVLGASDIAVQAAWTSVQPRLPALLAARGALLDASLALRDALAQDPGLAAQAAPVDVPGVVRIDLGTSINVVTADYALQVDAGGNDVYRDNAGGSNFHRDCAVPFPISNDPTGYLWSPGAAALIDLAGNDRYGDPSAPCSFGLNGGAYLGAGLLVDAAGNDQYLSASASNGAAYFGVGLLLDAAGDDRYVAAVPYPLSYALNGYGYAGLGMLLDGAGSDVYSAPTVAANGGGGVGGVGFLFDAGKGKDAYTVYDYGNGAGSVAGTGVLVDDGGDDVYASAAGASNGGGYDGGVGVLVDAGGNDVFTSGGAAANGGAALAAVGVLVDAGGDDAYRAAFGASNGGAAFASAAVLIDGAGDDTYVGARHGGVNGGAVQLSAALLLDAAGNDRYLAVQTQGSAGIGANGGAVNGALAALLDLGGDDLYAVTGSAGVNGGAASVTLPACYVSVAQLCMPLPAAVGLLLDTGGHDTYRDNAGGSGTDATVVPKGTLGAQIDLPR